MGAVERLLFTEREPFFPGGREGGFPEFGAGGCAFAFPEGGGDGRRAPRAAAERACDSEQARRLLRLRSRTREGGDPVDALRGVLREVHPPKDRQCLTEMCGRIAVPTGLDGDKAEIEVAQGDAVGIAVLLVERARPLIQPCRSLELVLAVGD